MYAYHLYDKTVGILSYTPGGTWGVEDAYVLSHTVPCRIRPLAGSERFAGGKETVVATHRVYCPVTTITEADRVSIDDMEYKVSLISRPTESNHLEIDVLRVQ